MREIKFRAWNPEIKEMLKGGRHDRNLLTFDGEMMFHNAIDGNFYKPKNFILMQYTGLKDKNGKEIYEGDIVHNFKNHKQNWRVDFEDGIYWLISDLTGKGNLMPSSGLEVIGNIYENPELINPKE